MSVEIKVPQVGESVAEVIIGEWLKREGDLVRRDEPIAVLESEKASIELPSPEGGRLEKLLKQKGESAAVGEAIALLDTAAAPAEGGGAGASSKRPAPGAAEAKGPGAAREAPAPSRAAAKPARGRAAAAGEKGSESPAGQEEPAPEQSPGPEPGPRDAPAGDAPAGDAPAGDAPEGDAAGPDRGGEAQAVAGGPGRARAEEVVPMSPLRRRAAEHLVAAQRTAALLTTFNEVDMSGVQAFREAHRDAFQAAHGVKLGIVSFFVKGVIDALKRVPQLNAEVRGTDIVYRSYFDIGVAVGGGKGLVVPVIRDADLLSFAELERAIQDLATRARESRLRVEELRGGTFTISNGGIYGSLLSTPIVNAPQSGILGMHAIQDRPVARGGEVVIRPMMYVALTYDHRLVDGREAVTFLKRVKECVEDPARMLVEV